MLDLLRSEVKRTWIIYWRYPLDFVSGLVVMFITFYVLVMGIKYVAGSAFQFGDRLDGLILGYWLWNLAVFAFSYTATALRMEALSGTLEQVYLSPFGSLRVFLLRCVASLVINLSTSTLLLVILLLMTGRRLSFPPLIFPPLATALMAAYGIGLLMAALTLLFKQPGQFLTIVQFLLLPMVIAPFESWTGPWEMLYVLLPIAPSATLLRDLMARQTTPDEIGFLWALVNGLAYLVLGMVMFHLADRRARRHGLVGLF